MSEDSLERYGGVLAAPPRPGWRTVLGVAGVIHAVAATVVVAIVVTHHATAIRCRTLSPPAGSRQVQVVAFSPNGRTLATVGANGYTYLWDVATGRLTATLSDPVTDPNPMSATSATFGPGGTTLAVVDRDSADLWNVTTNHLIAALAIPGIDSADSVAFSPNGRMLAVDGKNGDTYLWDVADRHLIASLASPSGFSGESLVFAPDGQMLATEDDDVSAYVWNVRTRRLIATLAVPDRAGGVSRVAFSPDGRMLAMAGGAVRLWDVPAKRLTATLDVPDGGEVMSVVFSPDGRMLAAATTRSSVYVWNVATGHRVAAFRDLDYAGTYSVAFSPDSRTLAVGDDSDHANLCPVSDPAGR